MIITPQNVMTDFGLSVARGDIDGVSCVKMIGHNNAIALPIEDVLDQGGLYPWLTTAVTMTISSADANDTSAGTGARTVTVYGLDANYLEISETLTMNGQTAVTTANSYLRVNKILVRTAGSLGYNAGNIYLGTGTVTTGVPAVIHLQISYSANYLGECSSLACIYTIPAGKTGFIDDFNLSLDSAIQTEWWVKIRPLGEVFQSIHRNMANQNSVGEQLHCPIKILQKTDICMRASAATSTDIAAEMELTIVTN